MKKLIYIFFFLAAIQLANAQSRYDSAAIAERFRRSDKLMNILSDFRFKCFIQPEWQKTDTAGAGVSSLNTNGSVQGGAFPVAANNRFIIRWGRFILGWQHEIVNKKGDTLKIGEFYFNGNFTEKGFTGLYDFYGRIIDPWTGWFSIRGGIFLRPFGFETPDNADVHESPEGNRVNQNVFPNIAELGEEIVIESPARFKPFYLRVDAGLVNGDGIQVGSETGAYQSRKDFLARIWFGKFWKTGEGSRFGFNASVSYYNGGVLQTDTAVYKMTTVGGQPVFTNSLAGTTEGAVNAWQSHVYEFARDYYGAHAQLNYDYKMGGTSSANTMIRGEIIAGSQPGQAGSNMVPTGAGNAPPAAVNLYIRNFMGGAFYFTQSFNYYAGKQLMHTDITFKYDGYNPNTAVKGSQIVTTAGGLATHLSTTDMSWNTFSGGVTFNPVPYFKLVLWYDHVVNESTGLAGFTSNYPKDDVFTIRTQFSIDSWWWDKKANNANLIAKQY